MSTWWPSKPHWPSPPPSYLQTHHIDTASVAGLENVCLKKGPVIEGEKMGIASQLRVISLSERGSAYETFH